RRSNRASGRRSARLLRRPPTPPRLASRWEAGSVEASSGVMPGSSAGANRVVGEADQINAELADRLEHARVDERAYLGFALGQIHRLVFGRAVAGVTGELRPAGWHLLAQHPLEELDADVLEGGDAPLPLGIEPAQEVHL